MRHKRVLILSLIVLTFGQISLQSIAEQTDSTSESPAMTKLRVIVKELSDQQTILHQVRKLYARSPLSEKAIRQLAFEQFRKRKAPLSIALLRLNSEFHPKSWQAWNALGDGYWTINKRAKAMNCYQRALLMDSGNRKILDNIDLLKVEIYTISHETGVKIAYKDGQPTERRGPYLGEKIDGKEVRIFAPGLVSTNSNMEFACTFSKDGRAFYFSRRKIGDGNRLMVSRLTEKGWTAPEISPIAKQFYNNEPHITYDGARMYFGSLRVPDPNKRASHFHTWFVDREGEQWGEPRYFGPGMFVSTSRDGHLFTTDITNFAGGGIVWYRQEKRKGFAKAIKFFNEPQKGMARGAHPCIDWQEHFLVFDAVRKDGLGGSDLYIVLKDKNGKWQDLRHLGDAVNSPGHDFGASLSPDGRYLFYTRNRDIYWLNMEKLLASLNATTM